MEFRILQTITVWKLLVFGVILSAFSRIRTEYGEIRSISPYSVRMRENADQNNSEYGYFLRYVWDDKHDNAYEKVDKRLEYFSSEWIKVVMIIDEV